MPQYRIEAFQALQFGDGRAPVEGGTTRSLALPWPSTIRGALRTAMAARAGLLPRLLEGGVTAGDPVIGGRDDPGSIELRGPLVMAGVDRWDLFVPRPADFDLFPDAPRLRDLVPIKLEPGDGLLGVRDRPPLVPLGHPKRPGSKPDPSPPELVPWSWLQHRLACEERAFPCARQPVVRSDTLHVRVVEGGRVAEKGGLFATEVVELADSAGSDGRIDAAFWVSLDGLGPHDPSGVITLGGQQGLARVTALGANEMTWAEPGHVPEEVERAIRGSGGYVRVVLLTPALFRAGELPDSATLLGGEVRAACVPRYVAVSGSRMERGGHSVPRRARRAAPAGSVFVVRYAEASAALAAARRLWFRNISDEPEDCAKGFGLAAMGGYPYVEEMDRAWDSVQSRARTKGGENAV